MKLFNPFRKPAPAFTSRRGDVAEALRKAKTERDNAERDARVEREIALAEFKASLDACNTQRQHKAGKRVRRATDRCLELGV